VKIAGKARRVVVIPAEIVFPSLTGCASAVPAAGAADGQTARSSPRSQRRTTRCPAAAGQTGAANPADVWRSGLAAADSSAVAPRGHLLWDGATSSCQWIDGDRSLLLTAALLLRQAGKGDRVVCDLAMPPLPEELNLGRAGPGPASQHRRATAGKAKASGMTLAERAADSTGGPRGGTAGSGRARLEPPRLVLSPRTRQSVPSRDGDR
jgi:hypothetical protein